MSAAEITRDIHYLASKCAQPLKIDLIEVGRLRKAGVDVDALFRSKKFYLAGFRYARHTPSVNDLRLPK